MKIIDLPEGTQIIENGWVITEPTLIQGRGPATVLEQRCSDLFRIDYGSQFPVVIRDLVVNAHDPRCDFSIIADGVKEQNRHSLRMLDLSGITIHGAAGTRLSYIYNSRIANCVFNGCFIGVSIEGISTNLNITDCQFTGVHTAVGVVGYNEGLVVSGCFMVDVVHGIRLYGYPDELRSSMAVAQGCHIDARGEVSSAIFAVNQDGLLVTGCYLIAGGPVIDLEQTFQSCITGSQLFMAGGLGVQLSTMQHGCNAVSIVGNTFHGPGTCVDMDENTWNCRVSGNTRAHRESSHPYRPVAAATPVTVDCRSKGQGNVIEI